MADCAGGWDPGRLRAIREDLFAPVAFLLGCGDLVLGSAQQLGDRTVQDLAERLRDGTLALETVAERLNDPALARDLAHGPTREQIFEALRHDLRNPLNAIIGCAEGIVEETETRGEEAAQQLRRDLEFTRREGRRLEQRLEAIFAHRAEAGATEAALQDLGSRLRSAHAGRLPAADAGQTGSRVLVVDDNEALRHLLVRWLGRWGYRTQAAADGAEALKIVAAGGCDAVLLDLVMPGMDGLEVLSRIRALPDGERLPVLMVSAVYEAEFAIACIEAGADDFVTKPFNPSILRARVASSFLRRRQLAAARA